MMELFNEHGSATPEANARRDDPATSKEAGRDIEESGLADRQRVRLLNYVRARPGHTALEIEKVTGIKAHKRLPELRSAGLVYNGHTRLCSVSNRKAMTWYPVR